MSPREFLENALGVVLVVLFALLALGIVLLVAGSVPMLVVLFPISATLVGAVLLIAYLRHRRSRRRRPDYGDGSE